MGTLQSFPQRFYAVGYQKHVSIGNVIKRLTISINRLITSTIRWMSNMNRSINGMALVNKDAVNSPIDASDWQDRHIAT